MLRAELWPLPGGQAIALHETPVDAGTLAWWRNAVRPARGLATKGLEGGAAGVAKVGAELGGCLFGGAIGACLLQAQGVGELVIEVITDDTCRGLPLEAAHLDGLPVVLRDRVVVVRRGGVPSPQAGHIPGPLRVLVAVAAADLDADHELGVVLDALDKTHTAAVDFVDEERGTLDGILAWGRDAGRAYHVLHISSHGHQGLLQLEDADGNPVRVEAGELAAALGRMRVVPRVVVLSSCHSAGEPDTAERVGFVDALLAAGVGCVIAMSHPVTDRYATALAGELYAYLEGAYHPDPVWGLAEARREVERKRLEAHGQPEEDLWGWPGEHVTPVCFVGRQGVGQRGLWPLFDRGAAAEALPRPPRMAGIAGFPQREIGYFVGRRGLRRSLRSAVLDGAGPWCGGKGASASRAWWRAWPTDCSGPIRRGRWRWWSGSSTCRRSRARCGSMRPPGWSTRGWRRTRTKTPRRRRSGSS